MNFTICTLLTFMILFALWKRTFEQSSGLETKGYPIFRHEKCFWAILHNGSSEGEIFICRCLFRALCHAKYAEGKKKKKKFNHKVSNTLNGVPNLFTFKMCFRMRQNIQQKNAGWHLIGLWNILYLCLCNGGQRVRAETPVWIPFGAIQVKRGLSTQRNLFLER